MFLRSLPLPPSIDAVSTPISVYLVDRCTMLRHYVKVSVSFRADKVNHFQGATIFRGATFFDWQYRDESPINIHHVSLYISDWFCAGGVCVGGVIHSNGW